MRITLGMISAQYNRNLNQSLNMLNYYNNRATTLRSFDKASENPLGAAKAFHLRREFRKNEDYMSNLEDTDSLMLTAQKAITDINKIVQETASGDCIQAINGTLAPEDRQAIAAKIRKMQEAIVSTANSKYGDKYLFGGNDTTKPPFRISSDGRLLYKNVDVTTGLHEGTDAIAAKASVGTVKIDFGKENEATLNGYTIKFSESADADSVDTNKKVITLNFPTGSTPSDADVQSKLQAVLTGVVADSSKITAKGNVILNTAGEASGGLNAIPKGTVVSLDSLLNQNQFIDIGLGLKVNPDGTVDPQSVFDASMPGISFLGCGVNDKGIPNNIFTLMGEIATQLESKDFSMDKIQPYLDNFKTSEQNLLTKLTEFGAKSNFLEYTKARLEENEFNLNVSMKSLEYLEPEVAIMDFKMQEFAYRAALQMGTKILQPSFLDFMR